MITNFEEYTGELTPMEKEFILPKLTQILLTCVGKTNALTNGDIVLKLNGPYIQEEKVYHVKTSGPRIRHMIHILRVTDTVPLLIATSQGYYISADNEEILSYIQSVDERLRHIYKIRRALKRQLRSKLEHKVSVQMQLF